MTNKTLKGLKPSAQRVLVGMVAKKYEEGLNTQEIADVLRYPVEIIDEAITMIDIVKKSKVESE